MFKIPILNPVFLFPVFVPVFFPRASRLQALSRYRESGSIGVLLFLQEPHQSPRQALLLLRDFVKHPIGLFPFFGHGFVPFVVEGRILSPGLCPPGGHFPDGCCLLMDRKGVPGAAGRDISPFPPSNEPLLHGDDQKIACALGKF